MDVIIPDGARLALYQVPRQSLDRLQ